LTTESEKLSEIEDLFTFVLRVQDKIAPEVISQNEMEIGEGRKGVLMIRGGNKWTRIFEVAGGKLIPSGDLNNARTVVVFDDVDTLRTLIQELLAGNTSAFSRARAKGEVKVVGEYAVRDLSVFNRLFSTAGQLLSSYGVKVGGE